MLTKYKKDNKKVAMGFLSYLDDFKNFKNLQDEMKLYETDPEFHLYMYRQKGSDIIGVVSVQEGDHFVLIRYLSMAPGYRDERYVERVVNELANEYPDKTIMTLPEYTYLLKYVHNE